MFYKKQDEQIQSSYFIDGQGYILSEENKDEHTYPKDGWIWANSLDEAIELFSKTVSEEIINGIPQVVTMRQARLALSQQGLLNTVNNIINNSTNEDLKIEWEYTSTVERNWQSLIELSGVLGLSSNDLDNLFLLANSF